MALRRILHSEGVTRQRMYAQQLEEVPGDIAVAGVGAHLRNRDVSGNFFQLLGVHLLAGRNIAMEDTAQGHGDVVLLSYDFWQRHFGGDLRALGQPMWEK